MSDRLDNKVGIFFLVEDEILLHTCQLEEASSKDGLLVYPDSHEQVWERCYHERYRVSYDYYPRGRLVYSEKYDYFILYYNHCSRKAAQNLHSRYREKRCQMAYDLSYRCYQCRPARFSLMDRLKRSVGISI